MSKLWDTLINLPYDRVSTFIADFIRGFVAGARAKGAVLGVSGGVDSSTTLALTVKALGAERVYALIMPDRTSTPKADVEDALNLVEKYRVRHFYVEINEVVDALERSMREVYNPEDLVSLGNVKARTRMMMLYYVANRFNLVVVGSGDKSELLIGYFTKYGDGGVDVLPIGGLYKSQVRELARRLGVPDHIAYKPSSPRLWPGQTAESELGLEYKVIDQVLFGTFELGMDRGSVAREAGVSLEVVDSILDRVRRSEHKRRTPPVCPINFRELLQASS